MLGASGNRVINRVQGRWKRVLLWRPRHFSRRYNWRFRCAIRCVCRRCLSHHHGITRRSAPCAPGSAVYGRRPSTEPRGHGAVRGARATLRPLLRPDLWPAAREFIRGCYRRCLRSRRYRHRRSRPCDLGHRRRRRRGDGSSFLRWGVSRYGIRFLTRVSCADVSPKSVVFVVFLASSEFGCGMPCFLRQRMTSGSSSPPLVLHSSKYASQAAFTSGASGPLTGGVRGLGGASSVSSSICLMHL